MPKKFAESEFISIFAIPKHQQGLQNAEIAQLVEHNLAKVGVASSSLVFRSRKPSEFSGGFFVLYCIINSR